jgi:hypothetical protein
MPLRNRPRWSQPFVSVLSALAALLLGLLSLGCGAEWRVIKQASPNPFTTKASFAVVAVDFKGLHVGEKTEEQYLAGKDQGQRESFEGDKDGINEKFLASVQASAKENGLDIHPAAGQVKAPFIIRPNVAFIEPGSPMMGLGPNSEVRMRIVIETSEGKKLDVIELSHETPAATWAEVSSGQRVRRDAEAIGAALAAYLAERTGTDPS